MVGAFGLAAVFSAEVSAADAVLFMLTTSLSQDLYRRFVNRSASDARLLRVTRLTAGPVGATAWTHEKAGKDTQRYHVVAVDALGQEGFPSAPAWHYRQFRKYYEEAARRPGNTGDALMSLLERRLDNVVTRLGFGSSRPQSMRRAPSDRAAAPSSRTPAARKEAAS